MQHRQRTEHGDGVAALKDELQAVFGALNDALLSLGSTSPPVAGDSEHLMRWLRRRFSARSIRELEKSSEQPGSIVGDVEKSIVLSRSSC
jgi:hypothetical protein